MIPIFGDTAIYGTLCVFDEGNLEDSLDRWGAGIHSNLIHARHLQVDRSHKNYKLSSDSAATWMGISSSIYSYLSTDTGSIPNGQQQLIFPSANQAYTMLHISPNSPVPLQDNLYGVIQIAGVTGGDTGGRLYYRTGTKDGWYGSSDTGTWREIIDSAGGQTINGGLTVSGLLTANGGLTTNGSIKAGGLSVPSGHIAAQSLEATAITATTNQLAFVYEGKRQYVGDLISDLNTRLQQLGFKSGSVTVTVGDQSPTFNIFRIGKVVYCNEWMFDLKPKNGGPYLDWHIGTTIFTVPSEFRPALDTNIIVTIYKHKSDNFIGANSYIALISSATGDCKITYYDRNDAIEAARFNIQVTLAYNAA